jgi:hypothetical protein
MMANQMIALQARAPQSAGLGNAVAQNAQIINMLAQQKAAERQNALAAQKLAVDTQAMEMAQRKETRDIAAADIDLAGKQIEYHYKRATAVNTPQGYVAWLAGVRKDSPEFEEFFRTNLPPEAFNRNALIQMVGSVKDNFDATYPKAEASLGYGLKGEMQNVITGGLPGVAGVFPLEEFTLEQPPARTGEVETGEQFDIRDGGMGGPMENAPANGNDVAGVASVLSNVNNDAEYQTVLNAINLQNPQMAASIRRAMPRFDPQRMAGIRNEATAAFGGTGAPDQPGLVAGERGGVGGPYVSTGRQAMGKSPMQAPMPGSAIVPLPRLAGEKTTETRATKSAERTEKLISDMPQAHAQTSSLINNLTDRINRIDKFLRNPYRNTVVGSIEGRIPEFLMNERRADAIADWKFITNNSVLDKLIQDRQSTETGASPQGLVSDRDLGVAASAANSLTRTGSEKAQEDEMKRLRDVLYRTRETALRTYTNTYGDLAKGDQRFKLSPRPVSPKYSGPLNTKRTRSGATVENWD